MEAGHRVRLAGVLCALVVTAAASDAVAQTPVQVTDGEREASDARQANRCGTQANDLAEVISSWRRASGRATRDALLAQIPELRDRLRACMSEASGSLGRLRAAATADQPTGVAAGATLVGSSRGTFPVENVSRVVRAQNAAFRTCYENWMRSDPTLAGRITVQFTIATSGRVSSARAVENATGSRGLALCVTTAIQRLRWNPGPVGGPVTFQYPFVFAPEPEPGPGVDLSAITSGSSSATDIAAQQAVERAIRPRLRGVRACYDAALRLNANLRGAVTLDVTVHPIGAVRAVTVAGDELGDGLVATCVRQEVVNSVRRVNPAPVGQPRAYRFRFGFAP